MLFYSCKKDDNNNTAGSVPVLTTSAVSNSTTYGKLYNWYSVNDSRKIAPTGWHVPSDAEWTILTTFLGGESNAARNLKESDTIHWPSPNDADNSSGFTALPGGYRNNDATFWYIGLSALWWSSTMKDATLSYARYINYNSSLVSRFDRNNKFGISVRCLKD